MQHNFTTAFDLLAIESQICFIIPWNWDNIRDCNSCCICSSNTEGRLIPVVSCIWFELLFMRLSSVYTGLPGEIRNTLRPFAVNAKHPPVHVYLTAVKLAEVLGILSDLLFFFIVQFKFLLWFRTQLEYLFSDTLFILGFSANFVGCIFHFLHICNMFFWMARRGKNIATWSFCLCCPFCGRCLFSEDAGKLVFVDLQNILFLCC